MFNRFTAIVLMISLAVVVAACGGAQTAQTAPPAQQQAVAAADSGALELPVNIDAQTVEQLRSRDDVVVLDVREDWEYAEGHVPGAVLLPLGQIPNRVSDIPTDKTVLVVCRSGNRSNQATQFLRQQGFENVHNMTGGMISWQQAGFDIEK
ncbi:MAG: hypothetical protein Kow0031_29160 [Anaerolineae bacterium]